jgi:hypothetical protein
VCRALLGRRCGVPSWAAPGGRMRVQRG